MGPIVRNGTDREWELVVARWASPDPHGSPPASHDRTGADGGVRMAAASSRDVVLQIRRHEATQDAALSEDRPLFAFAGLWTSWRGVRRPKSAPVQGMHELFGFLTTEANAIVAPVHPKAKDAEIARRYAACKDIAENHALLDGLEAFVHRLGVIGEEASIRGTYIAGTSRLSRDTAISYLRRGASAAGKNHSIIKILKLFPNEDVIVISSATAQALIYEGADANDRDALKHKD
jgi:hypothetical protein